MDPRAKDCKDELGSITYEMGGGLMIDRRNQPSKDLTYIFQGDNMYHVLTFKAAHKQEI